MNNFEKLNKFYFKGLDIEQNNIHILFFLSYLSEKCENLIDIGLSCKNLNSDDMNLILRKLKEFKYITKVNLFDNYTISDYYSYRDKNYFGLIDFDKVNDFYLTDLRNLNLKKNFKNIKTTSFFYPKIFINDEFHQEKNKKFSNKFERYYSYQNVFNNDSKIKIMNYSNYEKTFVISEIINN